MASRVLNIALHENITDFTADYILKSAKKTAVISGGKRPELFIKKKLAQKINKAFYPPEFFTNESFIENLVFESFPFEKMPDLEAAYILYQVIGESAPELLKGKASFENFLQWAYEILSFIDQLDMQNIGDQHLENVKANADIGFEVPQNINNILKNISVIRKVFHAKLESSAKRTSGYTFIKSLQSDVGALLERFDEIILLAPFYLHKTEIEIYKKLFAAGKLTIILHGNPEDFPVLKEIYGFFKVKPSEVKDEQNFESEIFCAFDQQSQARLLKNLVAKIPQDKTDKTVVIVPKPESVQSVISEIESLGIDYNVSAGYPASKTALFSLIKDILGAQLSRNGKNYYSKDLMKVLSNPLSKNMRFFGDPSVSRIIAHKIENALDSSSKSILAGKLFVSCQELLSDEELQKEIGLTVTKAWDFVQGEKIKSAVKKAFDAFFTEWEDIETLSEFSAVLLEFTDKILKLSAAGNYALNSQSAALLISCANELKYGEVSKNKFSPVEIINIFLNLIEKQNISLPGSPLKGLQVLGLLESRNLSFENVFIVSMTDSVVPQISKNFPLIPKEIMQALGIEIVAKEFEIQSYHFKRLVAGAKKVFLIYPDNGKEERSRFIESLVWKKQFEKKDLTAGEVKKFDLGVIGKQNALKRKYEKTEEIKNYLKKMPYSYSKIDAYLKCRLAFYFKYVLGLDENVEIGAELDGSDIGNFIHKFLQNTFHENLTRRQFEDENFNKAYMGELEKSFDVSLGMRSREDAFLIKKVLLYRMGKFLELEKNKPFKTIYKSEAKYKSSLGEYALECIIDRVDQTDSGYALYDYKTGKVDAPIISAKFNELLLSDIHRENIKKAVKSLQLPLYKYVFEKETGKKVISCGLYDIKKAEIADFPADEDVYEKCIEVLKYILDEISQGDYFEADPQDFKNCASCKYFYICR
ncbi:PD-(D/E)XK nuclease family protein [Endomicrobium proavitum]|uniref:PD-(D/E)XK endonuclease-like domain-containing protein n=1 Tax=Endomicrobium proavitum TaxID=1408281 RepID=A0A0G3WHV1_9BACT|nr:PD-(D/E)XK nuclease family protein [Endomicrobium proavitum]AKL98256.1 hypothetical protein Epro_0877 [Endomicrobium proavitum]